MFVPLIPMLCEQLFENPFFIIATDKAYFAANANNRGVAAERIVARILRRVRHLAVLENVQLYRKGKVVDQIDAAAVFGTTAILFEVKTKRLTDASKCGDTEKIVQDVRQGILDAKQQLADSKLIVLSRNYDDASEQSGDSKLLAAVRNVICVSIMTHEIPGYPLLTRTILEKDNIIGIIPVSVFDLKIIANYLDNAYDFIYYFAVRSVLDTHLMYGTEHSLLGYHFKVRLSVPENIDWIQVDDDFSQHIDADYPKSLQSQKLKIEFRIDLIDDIIDQIVDRGDANLFRLFSVFRGMSAESASDLKDALRRLERMLNEDGRAHDATMLFGQVALTFILATSAADAEARARLLMLKRDQEGQFEQEYMVIVSPGEARFSGDGRVGLARKQSRSRRFIVRGVAMKQRNAADAGITALSPRLPPDMSEFEP